MSIFSSIKSIFTPSKPAAPTPVVSSSPKNNSSSTLTLPSSGTLTGLKQIGPTVSNTSNNSLNLGNISSGLKATNGGNTAQQLSAISNSVKSNPANSLSMSAVNSGVASGALVPSSANQSYSVSSNPNILSMPQSYQYSGGGSSPSYTSSVPSTQSYTQSPVDNQSFSSYSTPSYAYTGGSGGAAGISGINSSSIQSSLNTANQKTQDELYQDELEKVRRKKAQEDANMALYNQSNPYEQQIQDLSKPSTEQDKINQELIDRQKEYTNIENSYNMGRQSIADQQIPMEFITGQQRSLENRFNNNANAFVNQKITPLQARLALAQSQRQASLDAAKASSEQWNKNREYNLNVLKAIKPDLPTSAQEYEYAVRNGYQGTYNQYQNEDANRKLAIARANAGGTGSSGLVSALLQNPALWSSLTPTVKTNLIPQLSALGFMPPSNLSSSQQDDIATMDTVSQLANQVLGMGDNLKGVGSLGAGTINSLGAKIGLGGKDVAQGQQTRNLIGNIKGTIAKLRGGTSFTPSEARLLNTYTPTINDNDAVIQQKLKDLVAFINTKKQNTIRATTTGASKPSNYNNNQKNNPLGL